MSEEIRRKLLARQMIRGIEDMLYTLENNAAPPIDWRPDYSKDAADRYKVEQRQSA